MNATVSNGWYLVLTILLALSWHSVAEEKKQPELSQEKLDQMMAPIALYPDALLSQILMASTYPDEVAEAVKWSEKNPDQKGDEAVKAVEDKSWDPSVASLVAFPQVLDMMGDKPDWVKQMGAAFLADPDKIMDTTQALRKKAKEQGNLESNEQQTVEIDDSNAEQTVIIIEPADPQIIYVPTYNPVVIYGPWWYPAYPPYYYYPPPIYRRPGYGIGVGIGFGIGIGVTHAMWGGFGWHSHSVNINVNRYNSINVNNKINVNSKNASWKHNANKKPSRGTGGKGRDNKAKPSNRDQKQDFRGRDTQRDQAKKTLDGQGMNPESGRKELSGSGGDKARNQVNQSKQQQGTNRQNPSTGNRANTGAQGHSRSGGASHSTQRSNNAFSGAGNSGRTNQYQQRGNSSNRSSHQRSGGGRSHGGGGGHRGGGGRR
ncbi:MAG: DUF3300 domain-containing protein [Pseudomonadales bacterium]|nr:DUF3300 domain-containing protein [Pseudomonadales bacterium]